MASGFNSTGNKRFGIMAANKDFERLELYKAYLGTATKTSEMRLKINAFFISINVAIVGAIEFMPSSLLLLFGIGINFLWNKLIKSYGSLNNAKFKVLHEIEDNLCHKCFRREEEIYKEQGFQSLTKTEKYLPYAIMMLYGLMLVYTHWEKIISFICSLCGSTNAI